MHAQYHEKHLFEKEKTFSSNLKIIHCFFSLNDSFKNTHQHNWEIPKNWENHI